MLGSDIHRDHDPQVGLETPVLAGKTRICARAACSAIFYQIRPGRGRPMRYCGPTCSHAAKLEQTRSGRRVWQDGRCPKCEICGNDLASPGPYGGRPRKRCPQCKTIKSSKEITMHKASEESQQYPLLDPEVVQAVPNLRDLNGLGKPIHDAHAFRQRLRGVKEKVLAELGTCSGPGTVGPTVRFDPSKDAAAILGGEVQIEALIAPLEETRRGSLLRQLRALEHAIPQVEDMPRQLECKIVPAVCEKLRLIAQDLVQATLDACENLLVAVRTESQFHELLSRKGVREDLRPGYMRPSPQALGWLGGDIHRPPLETFIRDRREAAGLDGKDK